MRDDDETADDPRVGTRAELSAEEKAAGSDDPKAQAEAVLADSDARSESADGGAGPLAEHRTSEDATEPQ